MFLFVDYVVASRRRLTGIIKFSNELGTLQVRKGVKKIRQL